ncbi:MAG: hypothetical protein FJW39_26795 [Acidobacteria bacterium]|nr:hypothetical protein [Acidobacteriota bacterium]
MNDRVIKPAYIAATGRVHCFLCSHLVPANVLVNRRDQFTTPGQSCPRCHSSLDSAAVLSVDNARPAPIAFPRAA